MVTTTLPHSLTHTLRHHPLASVELEFRVGRVIGKNFVPGVPQQAWDSVYRALKTSANFQPLPVIETLERIFPTSGVKIVHCAATNTRHYNTKHRLVAEDPPSENPWTVRGSLALETVTAKEPHALSGDTFIRRKQRHSFLYECWSFDLTKVVSSHPDQMDNDDITYEIEVELKDQNAFFKYTIDHIVTWGYSIANDVMNV